MLFSVLLLFGIIGRVLSVTCPAFFTNRGDGCYRIIDEYRTWTAHKDRCADFGGRLVTIHSEAENIELTKWFGTSQAWIGLNDLATDGLFYWAFGNSTYRNWRTDPLTKAKTYERNCVVTNYGAPGYWQDVECSQGFTRAICEADPICNNGQYRRDDGTCSDCPDEVNAPVTNVICPDGYTKRGEGCYHLIDAYNTWTGHMLTCEGLDGWTVTIESEEENKLLAQAFNGGLCFIGFNDLGNERKFTWIHGGQTDYLNWRRNPLDFENTDQRNCVVTNYEAPGYWQDVDCNRGFTRAICETNPICALGSYRNPCGTCSTCPLGSTARATTPYTCDFCLDGYYSTDGHAPCTPCPVGFSNNDLVGHKDCLQCIGTQEQCAGNGIALIMDSMLATINSLQRQVNGLNATVDALSGTAVVVPQITGSPTVNPTESPSVEPTESPSVVPSAEPSITPTIALTKAPSASPSTSPSTAPSTKPTVTPTVVPTRKPTRKPSAKPTTAAPSV